MHFPLLSMFSICVFCKIDDKEFCCWVFSGIEKDEDEDAELDAMTADYEQRGGAVLGKIFIIIFRLSSQARYSLGVVSWTYDSVLALEQRFGSHSRRLFCCNPLG